MNALLSLLSAKVHYFMQTCKFLASFKENNEKNNCLFGYFKKKT